MGLQILHPAEQGTVLDGTRRGDGVIEVLRAAGMARWRWSRHVGERGAWYLPGTRDRLPPYREIELSAAALRAAGFVVETSVDDRPRSMADAEADRAARPDDRAQRLADRAERHGRTAQQREDAAARILGGIPLGQLILVGHHTEGRHRRDLDRADAHERAGRDHDRRAADAARAAEVAAGHMRHRESPQVVAARLERLQAQRRRVQRTLDGYGSTGRRTAGSPEPRPVPAGEWRDRLLAQASLLDAQIRHWNGVHEAHRAAGQIDTVDWDQVRPGDLLEYRGRWEVVRRVNKATVTVVVDPGWNDKIVKRGVTAHCPATAPASGDPERPITGPDRARPVTGPAAPPMAAAPFRRPQRGGAPTAGSGP